MKYTLFGILILASYAWIDLHGYELTPHKRNFAPKGVRGSHGGYRSFWFSGYHGGK